MFFSLLAAPPQQGGPNNRPNQNQPPSQNTAAAAYLPGTSTNPLTRLKPDNPSSSSAFPTTTASDQQYTLGTLSNSNNTSPRLQGVRRITLSVPGVLLEEHTPAQLSESATIKQGNTAEIVKQLSRKVDLFLLAHVEDEIGEATVSGALEHCGVLGRGLGQVPPHRLLICNTLDGKVSFVRQLEPELHVDGHLKTVQDLQRFVSRQVLVGSKEFVGGSVGGNVERIQRIDEL